MLNEDLSLLKVQHELKSDFSIERFIEVELSEAGQTQAAAR